MPLPFQLKSSAFSEGGAIPSLYSCQGKDINPPLWIEGVPPTTEALVLILDDPDVPKSLKADGVWDHWLLFNLPKTLEKIEENSPPIGISGTNSWGKLGYGGPCPPDREHRYFFRLYALNSKLQLLQGAKKREILEAMKGKIIDQTILMGRYEKWKAT